MKRKIIEKGYTLTVDSWENDGDNCKTKSMTVESPEKARALTRMCNEVFTSIGNMNEDEVDQAKQIILPFMKSHPELWKTPTDTEDELVDICMDYNHQLMGGSEYYYSRVMESCMVTFSPEDIFLEEIVWA